MFPEESSGSSGDISPITAPVTPAQSALMLSIWFFITRFALYCGGKTIIAVPYDALGARI